MRYFKMAALFLLPFVTLAVAGCGGSNSSGGTTTDPFARVLTGTDTADPIFGNISTATGKTGITVTTDRETVDVNNGQVLVTAKVINSGSAVVGVPVTFNIVAPANGTATIEAGRTTVTTDSNGEAITRITTGDTLSTTNVIVSATATIGTRSATANTTFQMVRGSGVIMFTDLAGLNPGGQHNMLEPAKFEVIATVSESWIFAQLIPFKVTDSNGNPRVGVPVTLSVYSINSLDPNDVFIDHLVKPIIEPNQRTITTDSAGQGIFNVGIWLSTPPVNGTNTTTVVFKAKTNDAIPVTAYVGNVYTIKALPEPTEPTEPTEPAEPTEPTEPAEPAPTP